MIRLLRSSKCNRTMYVLSFLRLSFLFTIMLIIFSSAQSFGQFEEEYEIMSPNDFDPYGYGFGASVSISGNYAIIGAYGDENDTNTGSAYIFKKGGSQWIKQAKLVANDNDRIMWDDFGWSVAISGDYAIVGAEGDNNSKGSVYIFERNGSQWPQKAKLTAFDGETGDIFGWSVAISGDYAIVGAEGDDDSQGSAYIFKRNGANRWIWMFKLTASDGETGDHFGHSVAISGKDVIVSAYGNQNQGLASGSAYIFKQLIFDDGTSFWFQRDKLTADVGPEFSGFGQSVALSGDYAIVGGTSPSPYNASSPRVVPTSLNAMATNGPNMGN
ncbi:MAG: hypothetical protein GY801_11770 [bacterium]|nr:hypothetical protein [bacterium]